MKYTPVIGLEIHVELNTKSKMFCRCSADYFGKEPNSQVCPVCLGLPGALPYVNEEALKKCMAIGSALGCSVNESSRFERKNYFYPDLPKGYQISQYRWPLCVDGNLEMDGKVIRINRVHQEEDTGKLMHEGNNSLMDFNRSGVPLAELVTEPDFEDAEQVRNFAKRLQQLFRYLGVSEADMEKGQMRLEANVSVRKEREKELPNYRVELKNINSFSFMAQAINYEIERQIKAHEDGETLSQETRGWDQVKKETYLQRSKEEAHDYRYFPEPDLPELRVKNEGLKIKESLPELPWEVEKRLVGFGISKSDAVILSENREVTEYFEDALKEAAIENISPKVVANIIINNKIDIKNTPVTEVIQMIIQKAASVISDEVQIKVWVQEVINENSDLVDQYKSGKVNVVQALIGKVMGKSQGKADAQRVKRILEENL